MWKCQKTEFFWRPSWISANEWLEKNGNNFSFKIKGVKIQKSLPWCKKIKQKFLVGQNLLHNPVHQLFDLNGLKKERPEL